MDYETGKPLAGVVFALYEKFNDKDEVDESKDGSVTLYEGSDSGSYPEKEWQSGYTSSPVLWDGFRKVNSYTTDANGHIEADAAKKYHYEKTYCDGHPAPTFVPIPELPEIEVDEETGEDNSDEVAAAQAEIDAAKEQNRALAGSWCSCFDGCIAAAAAREGVHFHWLGDGVLESTIREIASSGGSEGSTEENKGKTFSEPVFRNGYDFKKNGFHALKETVWDAVKFLTGIHEESQEESEGTSNASEKETEKVVWFCRHCGSENALEDTDCQYLVYF